MATYKYTVEAIYETDKGTGKEYTNFNCEFVLSRFYPEGANSHILRRFLPMAIRKQKNKPLFSGIRHFVVTDIEKISDDFELEGKEIKELNEEQIQKLACMYDLFEIPLPFTTSITELREKAMLAYMKKVLEIPMKTPEEQAKLAFFKRQEDGTIRLDLGDEKLTVEVLGKFKDKKEEVKKQTLGDFIKKAGQTVANGILAVTGQVSDENGEGEKSKFPTADDLTN